MDAAQLNVGWNKPYKNAGSNVGFDKFGSEMGSEGGMHQAIDVRRVILDYKAMSRGELSIVKNDLVVIENPTQQKKDGGLWIIGRLALTQKSGIVPISCLSSPLRGATTELEAASLNVMLRKGVQGLEGGLKHVFNERGNEYYYDYYEEEEKEEEKEEEEEVTTNDVTNCNAQDSFSDDSFTDDEEEKGADEVRPSPTPPTHIGKDREEVRIAKVVYDYSYTVGDTKLVLQEGECVSVIDIDPPSTHPNHLLVSRKRFPSDDVSFVPEINLVILPRLREQPWYLGNIKNEEASSFLLNSSVENNTFLVRDIDESKKRFTICLRTENKIKYKKIITDEDGSHFIIEQYKFPSLIELIDFHSTCSDESLRIGIPFNKFAYRMTQPEYSNGHSKDFVSLEKRLEEVFQDSKYSNKSKADISKFSNLTLSDMIQLKMHSFEEESSQKNKVPFENLTFNSHESSKGDSGCQFTREDMSLSEQRKEIDRIQQLQAQLMKKDVKESTIDIANKPFPKVNQFMPECKQENNPNVTKISYPKKLSTNSTSSYELNTNFTTQFLPATPNRKTSLQNISSPKRKTKSSVFSSIKYPSLLSTSSSATSKSSSGGSSKNKNKKQTNSSFISLFTSSKKIVKKYETHIAEQKSEKNIKSSIKGHWEIEPEDIHWIKIIGSGHYGDVWRGTWKGYNKDVAVKTFKSSRMTTNNFYSEAMSMIRLRHPNLVKLFGVCVRKESSFLVMEFHSFGSILNYFNAKKVFSRNDLTRISLDVASGMSYLGDQLFIHRDLAARNVLLDHNLNAKIADFGLARSIEDVNDMLKDDMKMPWKWTAPEALKDPPLWSVECDIWSYGVFLWEIYSGGGHPYKDITQKNTLLMRLSVSVRLPPPFEYKCVVYDEIMTKCWLMNPRQRIPFKDIKHMLKSIL